MRKDSQNSFDMSLPNIFLMQQENAWFLQSENSFLRFYSKRSLQRDAQVFFKQWQEATGKEILLVIAPFVVELWQEIKRNIEASKLVKKEFYWISFFFTVEDDTNHSFPFLISNLALWQKFLQSLTGLESFKIFQHPLIKKIEKAESFSFQDWLKPQWQKAALRLKTIFHFEKIWKKNFEQNKSIWLESFDIHELTLPDALVFAGPSAQDFFVQKNTFSNIWVADTIVAVCLQHGIIPNVVFSIDGGISSYEHFGFDKFSKFYKNIILVMDVLSLPAIVQKTFKQKVSFASSYPAAQVALVKEKRKKTVIENRSNNVGGFMLAVYQALFGETDVKTFGNDGGHVSFVSHVRGSAYHQKQYRQSNRLQTCEQYFFYLSKQYYPR